MMLHIALILGKVVPLAEGQRIGIEIVVEHQPVHIVAADNLAAYLHDMFSRLRIAGIEHTHGRGVARFAPCQHPSAGHGVEGTLPTGHRSGLGRRTAGQTERINPGVQFHASGMSLAHGHLQGVPPLGGCLAAGAGEKSAPRLERRGVEGIRHRAHLQQHGVDARFLQYVEDPAQLQALGGGHIGSGALPRGPVDAVDRCQPCPAHLVLGHEHGLLGHRYLGHRRRLRFRSRRRGAGRFAALAPAAACLHVGGVA